MKMYTTAVMIWTPSFLYDAMSSPSGPHTTLNISVSVCVHTDPAHLLTAVKEMRIEQTTFSAESYFATQPPPPTLQQDIEKVQDFILRQKKQGRNVVLVTMSSHSYITCLFDVIPPFNPGLEWWYDCTIGAQCEPMPAAVKAS